MRFRPLTSSLLGAPDRISWPWAPALVLLWDNRLLEMKPLASGVPVLHQEGLRARHPGSRRSSSTDRDRASLSPGARHFLSMAPTRIVLDELICLARNTLLWEHGPLTWKGIWSLADYFRIARSFRQSEARRLSAAALWTNVVPRPRPGLLLCFRRWALSADSVIPPKGSIRFGVCAEHSDTDGNERNEMSGAGSLYSLHVESRKPAGRAEELERGGYEHDDVVELASRAYAPLASW